MSGRTYKTEFKLTGVVASSLRKSFAETGRRWDRLAQRSQQAVSRMAAGSARAGSAVDRFLSRTTRGYARLQEQLNRAATGQALAAQVARYRRVLERLHANQQRFGRSTLALERALREVGRRYREAKRQARAYGIDLRELAAETRRYARLSDRAARKLRALHRFRRMGRATAAWAGSKLDTAGAKVTALATGAGAAATVHNVGNLQERLTRLGIQANKSPEEIQKLKEQLFATATRQDIRVAPDQLLDAIEKIVEKTGNLELARSNLLNIGHAIQATGAQGADIGALVADMAQKFGIKTPDEMLKALDTMVRQGKAGAFTLQHLAAQGERVTAAYAALGRTGPQALREMGALLQVFRQGTGSAEQGATAFEAVLRELVQKSEKFEALGVEVWDPEQLSQGKKVARAVPAILEDLVNAVDGDIKRLGKLFGEEAARGIKVLVAEYQRLGMLESLQKFLAIQGQGKQLMEDSARAARTFNAALRNLRTAWERFADQKLTGFISRLADLLNGIDPKTLERGFDVLTTGALALGGAVLGRRIARGVGGMLRAWRGGGASALGRMTGRPAASAKSRLGRLGSWLAGAGREVQPVEVVNWPPGFGGQAGGPWALGGGKGKGKRLGRGRGRRLGRGGLRRVRSSGLWGRLRGLGSRLFGRLAGKGAGKAISKGLGKSLLKKIPIASLLIGGLFAAQRALAGDWAGAAAEAASGVLASVPGIGTAASLALDAALMAKDTAQSQESASAETSARPESVSPPAPALAPIRVQINQVVHLAPDTRAEELRQVLTQGRERLRQEVEAIIRDIFHRQRRISFGAVGD